MKMKVLRAGILIDLDENDARALVDKFPDMYQFVPEEKKNEVIPETDKKKKGK